MDELVYDREPHIGCVMTFEEWKDAVELGFFIDYDGYGCPMKDGKLASKKNGEWVCISPSEIDEWPEGATHIEWYNR